MVTKLGRFRFSVPSPYPTHDPIDGRIRRGSPVCSCLAAGAWASLSACMARSRHSSSACLAMWGSQSVIIKPDCPRGRIGEMGPIRRLRSIPTPSGIS